MADDSELTLHLLPGGTLLHTRECPHLTVAHLAALVPASAEDLETVKVCSACRAALDGGRRRAFTTVDQALEAFRAPVENRARIREVVAGLPHGYIWMPASASYVGISPEMGADAVAYVGKGYVDVHTGGGQYERHWLPTNAERATGGGATSPDRPEALCPGCHTVLPATGRCDTCDG